MRACGFRRVRATEDANCQLEQERTARKIPYDRECYRQRCRLYYGWISLLSSLPARLLTVNVNVANFLELLNEIIGLVVDSLDAELLL